MLNRTRFQPRPGKVWKGFKTATARLRARRAAMPRGNKRLKPTVDLELVKWSSDVRKRDSDTCKKINCEFCQNVEGRGTIAHHICPRSRRRDLKYDRSNGITLCEDAHYWCHFVNPKEATRLRLLSTETREKVMREQV